MWRRLKNAILACPDEPQFYGLQWAVQNIVTTNSLRDRGAAYIIPARVPGSGTAFPGGRLDRLEASPK